ncbi:hypothetical protein MW887_009611 [Aspergillus wentii]|nr:hypothetical protein MW887_009611 [Aspergillus wentii]
MGQRHNRRRTRPRSRNRSIDTIASIDSSFRPASSCNSISAIDTSSLLEPSSACGLRDAISIPSAHTWHYGYMAWQKRERKQRLEAAKMEAEQCRLFGGEPGDDVNLCYRMLEYFGGLDYINS